ncbi:E4 SUMO-protein ligase PIAL1-like isoform X3 [Telopea speciosissima]|uniref:E4 SUMO-protein ligase PIAL1-like isoform X2 n=1 Tax=Telopea speciosissima TaxID=54955 RepID=UPI001CC4E165|nr:E4 SUMO-protein ligase PIAL1-like isoform X2 [Telopea speciosissima]XP_043696236.1 E4 SUMO-protein ligase PIAL1-like isoform X3 [Telopea speciosissima]
MAGAITQRQPGSSTGGVVAGVGQVPQTSQMSVANSFRVAAVATRLALHIAGHRTDPKEFVNLCLALARGIDYAVANNEVPARAQELPIVVKQVCHRKNNIFFQAVIMVLMVSVKNACKNGWFLGNDNEELLTLANEIVSGFCSSGDINIEPSSASAFSAIPGIMSRFYPRMKMGHILASLEAKPGYGAYVIDFNIPKNAISMAQEKIRLFVAQTDSIETSSCIISPPQVNFLLNGKGVDRRINVSMDNGPQFPTNVNPMLKFGTNLLQVVGQFNGNYIIVIAFMSVISSPGTPVLQDYVQPVAAVDSDSDVIVGPSRISLNCPISHTRIRTPVKGHLCKHHQCFDYDNFLEINCRRPSWRCPDCNHSVCYTDLRIDRNMVKVLEEVAEGISDVIILVDGSWKSAFDSNDQAHQPHSGTQSCENNGPEQHEFSKDPANVVDLTGEDDETYTTNLLETEDRKPFRDNFQGYSVATSLVIPPVANTTAEVVLSSGPQIEDDFWEGIFLSTSNNTFGPAGSSSMLDAHAAGAISESTPTNFVPSPVLTDAISPAPNREVADVQGATQSTTFVHPAQFSAPFNLQIQPSQFGNSIVSTENGRPALSRNISRTPIAVQALPAQTQVTNSNQRLRTLLTRGAPPVSQSVRDTNFNAVGDETERQQQFSRSLMNPLPTSDIASSSSMQHASMIQSWDHQRLCFPTPSLPQVVGLPATSQVAGALRSSSQLTHQQPPNSRLPHFPRTQVQQGGIRGVGLATGSTTNQHLLPMSAGLRTAQMARLPTLSVQLQSPRTGSSLAMPVDEQGGGNVVQPVSRADELVELSSEHNWRPSGRMRGSLTGPAYSAALSQYMGQPNPAQVSGQPPNQSSSPSGPSQLHVLITNGINAHGLSQQAYSRTGEPSRPGSMGHLG